MAHLTAVRFAKMQMPIPPLREQERIVGALREAAAAARQASNRIAQTSELKATVLKDWLKG